MTSAGRGTLICRLGDQIWCAGCGVAGSGEATRRCVKRDPTGHEAVAWKVALLHAETTPARRATVPLQHIPDYLIAGVVLCGADLAETFYAGLYPLSAA